MLTAIPPVVGQISNWCVHYLKRCFSAMKWGRNTVFADFFFFSFSPYMFKMFPFRHSAIPTTTRTERHTDWIVANGIATIIALPPCLFIMPWTDKRVSRFSTGFWIINCISVSFHCWEMVLQRVYTSIWDTLYFRKHIMYAYDIVNVEATVQIYYLWWVSLDHAQTNSCSRLITTTLFLFRSIINVFVI